jgi:MscS family membrane protein
MSRWNTLSDQLALLIHRAWVGNELWRLIVGLAILVAGFIALEVLWRDANRRLRASFQRKGRDAAGLDLSGFLAPLRLGFAGLLLKASETPLILPAQLEIILGGIEAILLALAAILLLFRLVDLLDRLRSALPAHLQHAVPLQTLANLKGVLRIVILIGTATVLIYSQEAIFPPWLWRYPFSRYLLVAVVIVASYLLGRLLGRFLSSMTAALKETEEKTRLRLVLQAALWPIRLFLATAAVYGISEILLLPNIINRLASTSIDVLGTLALILFVYRLLDILEYELTKFAQREDTSVDQTFVQMVRIFTRFVVMVVGAIYLIRAISGKPMNTLLAGLGIGGLAVALAAQDTLKNFFGSVMIMLDKPFSVGHRVVVEGIDGVVETIGFRSTRVRTLTGHLVTVPNEKMASVSIENIGRRPSIRRLSNITITYDTPLEKVKRAVAIIRELLDNHEGMHPDFAPRVYFNEFNDTSLNIMMIYWYHPPDYWAFTAFNERVNLEIMREFEKEGIEFAFPTTTTYLAHDPRRPLNISFSGDPRPQGPGAK